MGREAEVVVGGEVDALEGATRQLEGAVVVGAGALEDTDHAARVAGNWAAKDVRDATVDVLREEGLPALVDCYVALGFKFENGK